MRRLFILIIIFALSSAGRNGVSQSRAAAATPPTPAPTAAGDEINSTPSPDGRWTAVINSSAGSLNLRQEPDGQEVNIFPAGSTVGAVTWSLDSRRLLVVRNNWTPKQPPGAGVEVSSPIEIWQVELKEDGPGQPARLYQSAAPPDEGPQQIVFGHWSPDSRYVLFWEGMLSASILSDGLPLFALDVSRSQAAPVAEVALLNPRYQSWSPDSARLAVTAGGYRSAQVDKWLAVWEAATGKSTTVISQTEQIPGTVAWSPAGDAIAYAAVPAGETGPEWADLMTFDNPAIAGRRIYLLNPATGQYHRLNEGASYQDAPVWSEDGATLYYVQRNGDMLEVMAADRATGQAEVVPGHSQPIDLKDPMQPNVGYYGQFGREELLANLPAGQAAAAPSPASPSAEDQEMLRFIFKNRRPQIGTLTDDFLNLVAAGQFSDFQRQEVDVNGDGQRESLVSGRVETYYLFAAILKRDPSGGWSELFYTDNTAGKYIGEVRLAWDGRRVVADFLTSTGGTGYVDATWEQRWIECGANRCSQVWAGPLLWADRNAQWALSRNYVAAALEQPDDQTIRLTTRRFGLKDLPWGETGAPPGTARRVVGPDTVDTYRWDGQAYRLESREQLNPGQEIAREFDWQTEAAGLRVYEAGSQAFNKADGSFDSEGYLKQQAEWWGLPAPDQADDPSWGGVSRQPEAAAHTGLDSLEEWVAQMKGALDKLECRLLVQHYHEDTLTVIGRLDLPCTANLTRLAWVDVTGDGQVELLLTTLAPDEQAMGQIQRLHVYSTAHNALTELAALDGVINGPDGVGIRWEQTAEGFEVQAGLPLIDPDANLGLADLRREREFQTYRWDEQSGGFEIVK